MGRGLPGSPYTANLRRLGYGDEDLLGDGSDRLVDDLVAWGDEAAVLARVRQQLDAGADHVLVHPLAPDLRTAVDQLERLAPALLELNPAVRIGGGGRYGRLPAATPKAAAREVSAPA